MTVSVVTYRLFVVNLFFISNNQRLPIDQLLMLLMSPISYVWYIANIPEKAEPYI